MTCTLILPNQRFVLNVSLLGCITMRNFEQIGKLVKLLLIYHLLINNDSIIHVATLDKVSLEQGFNIAHKNKSAGRCYFFFKVFKGIKRCKLTVDKFRIKRTHRSDTKFIVGQNSNTRPRIFIFYFYLMTDNVIILRSILLFYSHTVNLFYIHDSRAIKNREFGTIYLNKTIVNT